VRVPGPLFNRFMRHRDEVVSGVFVRFSCAASRNNPRAGHWSLVNHQVEETLRCTIACCCCCCSLVAGVSAGVVLHHVL
jgi:hypothetical protein